MSGDENINRLQGQSIIQALVNAGVKQVVALPDIVTCASTLWPMSTDSRIKLTQVCKEDEGVSMCAALSYCEQRAILFMQHTGFLDSINAIRAIATDYQLPVVMLVGMQGLEANTRPADSASPGVRMLQPICDAMELDHHLLDNEADVALIGQSIEKAYTHSSPVVLFISQSPEV